MQFDVLVAGEINPDLILSGPDLAPRFDQQEVLVQNADLTIGSSSAIFACGAARLGLKVAFIGVVGADLFGRFMLEALKEQGVDVSAVLVDDRLKTGFSVILSRGADRAILTHPGAIGALQAEEVTDGLLRSALHLHIASYFLQTGLQPGLPDLFRRARRLGLSISLDTNWDPAEEWQGVAALLGQVDVFLPNQAEALVLARAMGAAAAARTLAKQVPVVAVKLGARGGLAQRGLDVVGVHPPPVEVVDTVGAGDSFDAGFVYGFLQGWTLEHSLKLAVACGSLSTTGMGGTAAQPTLEEAQRFIAGMMVLPREEMDDGRYSA